MGQRFRYGDMYIQWFNALIWCFISFEVPNKVKDVLGLEPLMVLAQISEWMDLKKSWVLLSYDAHVCDVLNISYIKTKSGVYLHYFDRPRWEMKTL